MALGRRRLIGFTAAALLAVLGTFLLVTYVQSARNEAVAGQRLVGVFIVQEPIPKGTAAKDIEGFVEREDVPARLRAPGYVVTLDDVKGLVTDAKLLQGEQLVKSRFVSPQAAAQGDVPAGSLQLTLPLDPERAVGGQLRRGSTVAVIASFEPFDIYDAGAAGLPAGTKTPNTSHIILHGVPVTAVQFDVSRFDDESTDEKHNAPTGKLLVTLALDGPSVEKVVFAAEHGTVWLSAEPSNAPTGGTGIITRGNVYG
jgi:pilus assembly protein CpaB